MAHKWENDQAFCSIWSGLMIGSAVTKIFIVYSSKPTYLLRELKNQVSKLIYGFGENSHMASLKKFKYILFLLSKNLMSALFKVCPIEYKVFELFHWKRVLWSNELGKILYAIYPFFCIHT